MAKVSMSTKLPVSAKSVWDLIGGFNAVPSWHPAVEKSSVEGDGKGSVRTLHLLGGGVIRERLEQADDDGHVYTYSILEAPLPVRNYTATIRVRDAGDGKGCVVDWESEFEPAGAPESDAMAAVQGIYQAGLDNLKKMFGG